MTRAPASLTLPAQLQDARVLVVGDLMLDRYWFGEVERISPEAPVPIVRVEKIEERLGGAANVAKNISALGAHATLISVIGDDEAGRCVHRLFEGEPIEPVLHIDPSVSTTVKLRILGRQQQLVRADFESYPDEAGLLDQLAVYQTLLDAHDVVVLSDYGKGGLVHIRKMIELAKNQSKPVIIDPKGDDYDRYRGATLITPNRAELREVVGKWTDETDLDRRVKSLMENMGFKGLLLTRSEEGMSLFTDQGRFDEPTVAREVFDVSGAGDTVIGVFSTAVAAGCDWVTAMRIANCAAGIVVSKLGTAVATLAQLQTKLSEYTR